MKAEKITQRIAIITHYDINKNADENNKNF